MKVKFNIDDQLPEERAEFWLRKMTDKMNQIAKELSSKDDMLWCYQDQEILPINFDDIFLIEVENDKTVIYSESDCYEYKGRLYQVKQILPYDFISASRSAVINYRKIDHLELLNNGNIDVIMKNNLRVQISRRKIKALKERLGL